MGGLGEDERVGDFFEVALLADDGAHEGALYLSVSVERQDSSTSCVESARTGLF